MGSSCWKILKTLKTRFLFKNEKTTTFNTDQQTKPGGARTRWASLNAPTNSLAAFGAVAPWRKFRQGMNAGEGGGSAIYIQSDLSFSSPAHLQ